MNAKIRIADLPDFDLAEYLKTDEDIAAYLTLVIEEGDASELAHALGVAARARGMTQVARDAGLSRESLYRALSGEGNPDYASLHPCYDVRFAKL